MITVCGTVLRRGKLILTCVFFRHDNKISALTETFTFSHLADAFIQSDETTLTVSEEACIILF